MLLRANIFAATLVLLLVPGCQQVHSPTSQQVQDTSLANAARNYANKAFDLSEKDFSQAMKTAQEGINISIRATDSDAYAACINAIGWIYFKKGANDSALYYLNTAKNIHARSGNKHRQARSLINIATVYENESNYPVALQNLSTAISLINVDSERVTYAVAEKMIGIIYKKQQLYDKAKEYLKKSIHDFSILNEPRFYADAMESLGGLYLQIDQPDSAAYYYHNALPEYQKENDRNNTAIAYENLGDLSMYMWEHHSEARWLDSALRFYTYAYNAFVLLKDQQNTAYEKYKIAGVWTEKRNFKQSKHYLLQALHTFDSLHATPSEYEVAIKLSKMYAKTGDDKNAYKYLALANDYNDTLQQLSKKDALAEMLAKYEADKKDREIALLNAQKELSEHKLSKRRLIELFSLLLFALAIVLVLVLLNRYRIKQKLVQMQIRDQIANDLHDDVGSSLSSILLLSKMAARPATDKTEMLTKITGTAQEVIEKISDIVWTTNPKYDEGERLHEKIVNYLTQVGQASGLSMKHAISDTIDELRFPMETRKNIFLVIKEAINNVVKHAGATSVDITIDLHNKNFLLQIADDGQGFDVSRPGNGNGLSTMRSRVHLVGGTISFRSTPGCGTIINIAIPI